MPKPIEVPGVGVVDFPDEWSNEQIQEKAQQLMSQAAQQTRTAQPIPRQPEQQEAPVEEQTTTTPRPLTEGQEQQIARLQEMAQMDPSQAESAQAQIQAIRGEQKVSPMEDITDSLAAAETVARASIAEPIAGLAGIGSLMIGEGPDQAAATVRGVSSYITGEPRTERAREALQAVAVPFAAYEDAADWAAVNGGMGNPTASTIIKTGLVGALDAIPGVRSFRRARRLSASEARRVAAEVRRKADDLDIPASGFNWRERSVQAAQRMSPETRAADMENLQTSLRAAREAGQTRVNQAYQQARQTPAWVQTGRLQDLTLSTIDDLEQRGLDIAPSEMPTLNRRLEQLMDLDRRTPTGRRVTDTQRTSLNDLDIMQRRLNQDVPFDKPRRDWTQQDHALNTLRKNVNQFVDQEFNRRMISGDPEAIANWRQARGLAAEHRQRFDSDKALAQLIELEASPEEMRNWLLGASDNLPKPAVNRAVKRIKDILGEDSPQFHGLKLEFMRGLMRPLLQRDPGVSNFRRFVNNVDTFIERYPGLVQSLDFDTSQVRHMRNMVDTFEKRGIGLIGNFEWHKLAARFTVGHQIARKAAMVALTATGLRYLTGRVFGGNSRAAMNELISQTANISREPGMVRAQSQLADFYNQPFISKTSLGAGAVISAAQLREFGLSEEEIEQATEQGIAITEEQQLEAAYQ